jgi:hypothetical protein
MFHLAASYHASAETLTVDEKIFAWEKATASYLNLDDEALNRCIQAGNKYFCNEAKVSCRGHHRRV